MVHAEKWDALVAKVLAAVPDALTLRARLDAMRLNFCVEPATDEEPPLQPLALFTSGALGGVRV